MRTRLTSAGVVLAACVLVAWLVIGCTSTSDNDGASPGSTTSAPTNQADIPFEVPMAVNSIAAQNFLDAWERSRTSQWYVETVFERSQAGVVTLTSTTTRAQRPPDQVYRNATELDRVVSGLRTQCVLDVSVTANGGWRCSSEEPFDVAAQIDTEIEALAELTQGPQRVYQVAEDPTQSGQTCFRLGLSDENSLGPEYGIASRFCFDDETGAIAIVEIVRQLGSLDRTEAVVLDPVVPSDVFDLPV